MRKILFIISFLSIVCVVNAQQELLLSQQFYSRVNKNPAGIGNISDIDLFLLGHYQYAGVDDAPKTLLLNAQTFFAPINSGVGFTFSFDDLGIARSFTNVKASYAYAVRPTDNMLVSFGLGFGLLASVFDVGQYTFEDNTEWQDGTVPGSRESKVRPDMDFGVEFALNENLLAGASVTHLLNNEAFSLRTGRHYYFYGRYLFRLNETWDLAPMLTYMHCKKTNVLEVNATAIYNRFVWGGLTWHPDMSDHFGTNPLAITLGVEYKRFRLGYTFDAAIGHVSRLSATSHELMFSYSIDRGSKSAPKVDLFE